MHDIVALWIYSWQVCSSLNQDFNDRNSTGFCGKQQGCSATHKQPSKYKSMNIDDQCICLTSINIISVTKINPNIQTCDCFCTCHCCQECWFQLHSPAKCCTLQHDRVLLTTAGGWGHPLEQTKTLTYIQTYYITYLAWHEDVGLDTEYGECECGERNLRFMWKGVNVS